MVTVITTIFNYDVFCLEHVCQREAYLPAWKTSGADVLWQRAKLAHVCPERLSCLCQF